MVDAAKVLPPRELLQSENVVEYMYYDCDTLILGDDISDVIRLTIAYTDEEYLSEKERLEQLYLQSFPSSRCTQFNYNGVIYDGFEFFGENKKATCGLAYHICAESKTIIYFAFFTMEMSFMSVNDAIKYSIGSKYESEFACCPSVPESN